MADNAQEVVLKITGDAASGKAAVDAMIKGMSEAGRAATDSAKMIRGMSEAGRQAAEAQAQAAAALKTSMGSWKEFTSGFDLKTAIESPASAASGALEALAGTFGVAAAGAAGAGVVIAGALFHVAENAAAAGARINDLAETNGMAVPQMSRFANIAAVAGTDVKNLSDLVFKMQVEMQNSPEAFEKGLKGLSISAKDFEAADWNGKLRMVAEAAKGMGDVSERNAALVNLMGKHVREEIPTLLKLGEAEAMVGGAHIWTEEQSLEAEHFEMQLNALKLQANSLWEGIGVQLIPVFSSLIELIKNGAPVVNLLAQGLSPLLYTIEMLPEAVRTVNAEWALLSGNLQAEPARIFDVNKALKQYETQARAAVLPTLDLAAAKKLLTEQLKESQRKLDQETEAAKRAAEAEAKLQASAEALAQYRTVGTGTGEALAKLRDEVETRLNVALAAHYELLERIIPATREWWTLLPQVTGEIDVLGSHGLPAATGAVADLGSGVIQLGDQIDAAMGRGAVSAFKKNLTEAFADIPNIITHALTGGGGMEGAFAAIGTQLGSVMAAKIGESISSKMGAAAGEGAGDAAGGGFLKMFGGAGGLAASLATGVATMGISVGVQALMHFASKIGKPSKDELEARSTFAKQGFENVDDFIKGISKRAAAAGIGGEEVRLAIQKVLDATHISASAEKSAIEELNTKLTEAETKAKGVADAIAAANAKPDFEGLTQKAAGFGVTLDALGPKFQQVSISKTAADYMTFFDDAKAAGADLGGVLLGMSDEFSTLVQNAIKFGSTLPAAMKPLIQNLIDAGKLTDDQGNAIDDITQIKFDGSPTQTGIDDLKTSLGDATDLVVGPNGVVDAVTKLGQAIDEQIPTNPFAHWQIPDLNLPSVPNWGGAQASGGLYRVTRPTLFLAGEKPGGEDVAFSGTGKRLGGGVSVTVNVAGSVWSEHELGDVVHDRLSQILRGRTLLRAG